MENEEPAVGQNPLDIVKNRMSACFGAKDHVFAEQNQEFKKAKDLMKIAKLNNIGLDQFTEIASAYLKEKGLDEAHIEKQVQRIKKKAEARL